MYLLSYENSEEVRSAVQASLIDDERYSRSWKGGGSGPQQARLKAIDPAYGVNPWLAIPTRNMLKELTGKPADLSYSSHFYGRTLTPADEVEIGRAMVLADREFGAFDEIALKLMVNAFEVRSGGRNVHFTAIDRAGSFGIDELGRLFLGYYLSPPGRDSYGGLAVRQLKFHREGRAAIDLEFSSDGSRTGEAVWRARGVSKVNHGHLGLVRELNRPLQDFRMRMELRERYQSTEVSPGLDESTIQSLRGVLAVLYSNFNLDSLRPDLRFADEPISLKSRTGNPDGSWGYIGRCDQCRQIVALELLEEAHQERPLYWDQILEDRVRDMLLLPHRNSGCRGTVYNSSRTGEQTEFNG